MYDFYYTVEQTIAAILLNERLMAHVPNAEHVYTKDLRDEHEDYVVNLPA